MSDQRAALVDDLFLCATNDSTYYDRFLRKALYARDNPDAGGQRAAAQDWAILATDYTRGLYRSEETPDVGV
jgi:hypothetical protein